MIVGSLLLILVAVGLLVVGLVQGSSAMLVSSIVASLLAAVALVVGARQAAAARAGARSEAPRPADPPVGEQVGEQAQAYLSEPAYAGRPRDGYGGNGAAQAEAEPRHGSYAAPPAEEHAPDEDLTAPAAERGAATIPAQHIPADEPEPEPADEPAPQRVPAGDAARVARMSTEVLVIDGRPRYHVAGCVHLLGQATQPLPVGEAVEIGFTPCGLCEPDSALLADAGRV